jgi:hypothetical protein
MRLLVVSEGPNDLGHHSRDAAFTTNIGGVIPRLVAMLLRQAHPDLEIEVHGRPWTHIKTLASRTPRINAGQSGFAGKLTVVCGYSPTAYRSKQLRTR